MARPGGARGERTAEALALLTVGLAPLALGAVHAPVLIALATIGWASLLRLALTRGRRALEPGLVGWGLVAICAVVALQLVPLPEPLLRALAPASWALRVDAALLAPGDWAPLTLDSMATALELAQWAGWTCVALVLQHRARSSPRAMPRLMRTLIASAALVVVIGIAHAALGATTLFGLYRYERPSPFLSTFGNPNHLAGFLAAGALVSLGGTLALRRPWERYACLAVALGSFAALVLSESRGGLVAGLLATALLAVFLLSRRSPWTAWIGPGALVLTALGALLVVTLAGESVAALFGDKLTPVRLAWRMVRENPQAGIGRGAFETAHTRFLDAPAAVTYTHVENEALQALAEFGLVAGLAVVAFVVWVWLRLARRASSSPWLAAAASASAALLLQSFADFGLHHATGLVLIALLASGSAEHSHSRASARLEFALTPALGVLLVIGAANAWPWHVDPAEELRARAADDSVPFGELERQALAIHARRPADYLPSLLVARRAMEEPSGALLAWAWIGRVRQLHPQLGVGAYLEAEANARLGRKEAALDAYRTAGNLGFPAMTTVLDRFPDPRDLARAAPSRPEAAVDAARTLEQADRPADAHALVLAALAFSPRDPALLESAARLATKLGRGDDALAHARRLRELQPDSGRAWYVEATTLSALGRRDDAREAHLRGLERVPDDDDLRLSLALLELNDGRLDAALDAAERLSPAAAFARHSVRGHVLRRRGVLAEARDEYLLALRSREDVAIRRLAAQLALELNRFDDARADLQRLPDSERGVLERELERRQQERLERQRDALLDVLLPAPR